MSAFDQTNGRAGDEMTCKELVEVITAYIEETMPDHQVRRLEAHLRECPYCVSYVEQMRQTIEALGSFDPDSLTPEARDELLAAFRDWRGR